MSGGKIFLILAGVLLCLGLLRDCADDSAREIEEGRERLVDTLVYVDTVRYYMPVAKDSAVVRYVSVRRPQAGYAGDGEGGDLGLRLGSVKEVAEADAADSIRLPVVSRHYGDSTYEAWVSGPVDPRLDSITVFPRREVVRISEPPNRGRRWGLGVFAGCGMTPHGMEPCAGISVNYNIWTF